jgi:multidrug transporter EmrE-like cation transporter
VVAAAGCDTLYIVYILLAHAVKQLPAATVYAAFTGTATAETALALIVVRLIGPKVFSGAPE